MDEFGSYIPEEESDRQYRAYVWKTAIGLQAVDGLQTSDFLRDTARRHVEGDISMEEACRSIRSYYETRQIRTEVKADTQEADLVAGNIARLLSEPSFRFMPTTILEIHRRVFEGVFSFAGEIRQADISKKEWVLRDASVAYCPAALIRESLEYDIAQELNFSYAGLSQLEMIAHIAKFIAGIWQIHPFAEGNTRTTAVFLIKYMRYMGYEADNAPFEQYSWYFRNALVRANYRNHKKDIQPNFQYLELFLRNLLLGEENELKNRHLLLHE